MAVQLSAWFVPRRLLRAKIVRSRLKAIQITSTAWIAGTAKNA